MNRFAFLNYCWEAALRESKDWRRIWGLQDRSHLGFLHLAKRVGGGQAEEWWQRREFGVSRAF